MNTIEIASLILSLLATDDALTAQEITIVTGLTRIEVRSALRGLRAAGLVTTSGRTRGTRYLLLVEECEAVITPARASRRARAARINAAPIEVVDLTAQLAATLALATPAAPLSSTRLEHAPLAQLFPDHAALVAAIVLHDPFQITVG